MAKDKKGFVLYADQKELFDQLPNEKAGELIKHIFAYVNDEDPETKDLIIKLAFTPIKQQFKRDLEKWEKTIEGRSKAGKASAEARANKKQQALTNSTNVKPVQQTSTNPTVNVKDNVNVNVTVNDKVKETDIRKKEEPPTYEEFSIYSFSKARETNINLDETKLKLKFSAWMENGWKDGHDKKIKNWKSKILQTLQYLKTETNGITKGNAGYDEALAKW